MVKSNLVSIVLPVYDTGAILQETIDSVLAQTFSNLELIIVDDGSSDPETARILARQNDERIKIIQQANAGVAAARNTGITYAQGRYIAFIDHDDLFLPEKLMESLQIFNSHKDAVLVYSDTIPIGDFSGRVIEKQKISGRIFNTVITDNPILSMSCSVVDKAFLDKYNVRFDPECVPCDDWDFHLQCALHGKLYCTPEPLVKYRYHQNNLSSNAVKMYNAGINVINKYQAMMPLLVEHSGCTRRTLQKSIDHIAFKHYYGLAFEHLKKQENTKALRSIIKAFSYRPLKCIGKILRFAGKKTLKK